MVTLLDREILDDVTGIDERFVVPQGRLSLMCGVASANSFGSSNWTYSPMVTVRTFATNSSATIGLEAINSTDRNQLAAEDLSLDQLLEMIHNSHVENLPSLPVERPPEVRVIVKPNKEEDEEVSFSAVKSSAEIASSDSETHNRAEDSGETSVDVDTNEDDLDRIYEMLVEDVRRAIGADEASKLSRTRSLEVFGLLDRVL